MLQLNRTGYKFGDGWILHDVVAFQNKLVKG